jgi:hypothetical protein
MDGEEGAGRGKGYESTRPRYLAGAEARCKNGHIGGTEPLRPVSNVSRRDRAKGSLGCGTRYVEELRVKDLGKKARGSCLS